MIKDPILNAVTFLMIPFIILFGLYIQFHGDYTPGGGFQAGIIIASGIILYSMLFGVSTTLKAIPYSVIRLTNVLGILIYGGTGVATTLLGQSFLSYDILSANNRTGQKLGIFFVELGVAFTVCSSMLIIYINFARRKKKMTLYNYTIIIILMVLGLYIIINDKNLIKKMIGVSVFQASVLLFYISLGYIKSSLPPILVSNFYSYSNPIPHVLMLTAIVVGIATFSVGLSIAVTIEEKYGIIDQDKCT